MISFSRWVSRASTRLTLVLVLVTALSAFAVASRATHGTRTASVTQEDGAAPPRVTHVGRVRFIASPGAAERIVPDTIAPEHERSARLLWLAGRPASQTSRGSLVLDPAGGVVEINESLHSRRLALSLSTRTATDVVSDAHGGLWIADDGGHVLRADDHGKIIEDFVAPFHFAALAVDRSASRLWMVRSPERFSYAWDSTASTLIAGVGAKGVVELTVGRAILPQHVMLQDLANSGRIAVAGGRIYYAPFIRDQIVAMDTLGDTLWVASRDLPQTTREPRFEVRDGHVVVDYHAVNLGIVLGPDARLYVLSTPGPTTLRSRLDAFDPATGHLLRSVELDTALPTIAVDGDGRVYLLDATRILTGVSPRARETIGHVTLAMRGGTRLDTDSLHGHVTLINFWASWCAVCRTELPALDSLRRAWSGHGAMFVSVNADASPVIADKFLRGVGLEFDYAVGGPSAGAAFHAPGLPFTVLLDRQGRVVQHWAGYAGGAQMGEIDAALRLEVEAGRPPEHHKHS